MINPKVSVITPVLNSEKTISACIESVASQSYRNIEHLIIDGVSSDSTLDIIRDCQLKYPHIKYFSEKDDGIYNAMNKGLKICTGDWVYFLGSDDVFLNADILHTIFLNQDNADYGIIYGNVIMKKTGVIYNGVYNSLKLIKDNICHQSIFFRKDVFEILGNFNEKYRVYADWVFNMKWFHSNIKHKYINQVITIYDETGFSNTVADDVFFKERKKLSLKYFPWHILLLYYYINVNIKVKNKIVKLFCR